MNEIAVIEWLDVSKSTNDEIFDKSHSPDDRLANMKTIGWIYQETEKVILLVQEFDEDFPRDWIVIPKVLITKMEKK